MRRAVKIACVGVLLASAVHANELIGKVVPPYPFGLSTDGGFCIGNEPNICARSIEILKTSSGRDFLILAGLEEPRQGKAARWRVSDMLAFPDIPRNSELADSDCRKSQISDSSIIAVVRSDPKQQWLRARGWAYRVEASTGKFVKLDSKDVDCANPALDAEN